MDQGDNTLDIITSKSKETWYLTLLPKRIAYLSFQMVDIAPDLFGLQSPFVSGLLPATIFLKFATFSGPFTKTSSHGRNNLWTCCLLPIKVFEQSLFLKALLRCLLHQRACPDCTFRIVQWISTVPCAYLVLATWPNFLLLSHFIHYIWNCEGVPDVQH